MAVSAIREDAPAGLDTTTPNVARMYDYLLGGKDNFAADLSRPVGLICVSALHFVPDEADPWGIIAQYRDRLCPGSYLTITHAPSRVPGEDPEHDEENAAQVCIRLRS
jgi:hypothetical protein